MWTMRSTRRNTVDNGVTQEVDGGRTIVHPRYRQPLDAVMKLLVSPPIIEPFPSAEDTETNGSGTVGIIG